MSPKKLFEMVTRKKKKSFVRLHCALIFRDWTSDYNTIYNTMSISKILNSKLQIYKLCN